MFDVLTAHGHDAEVWQAAWERLPDDARDLMFTSAYARVQESSGQGKAYAALYRWEKYFVLQPFMLRDAGDGKTDMASFYGGGGPVTNMDGWSRRALWEWFDRDFSKWRTQHNVVCEYAQLHLIATKSAVAMLNNEVTQSKQSVLIALGTDDEILSGMSETRRQTLRRGQRDGLIGIRFDLVSGHVGAFYTLYTEAMKRKGADARWMLPADYFLAHFSEFGPRHMAMMAVNDRGNIVTTAIVLFGGSYASFHFAASIEKAPQGASDIIIFESARMAREAGCKTLNLGGGVTSDPKDSLLWFKAGFSPLRGHVYTVKRTFDQDAYDKLCAAAKVAENETYYPAYRKVAA